MDLLVLAVGDVGPQSPDVDSRGAHSGDRSSASPPAPSPWPTVAERAPFSGGNPLVLVDAVDAGPPALHGAAGTERAGALPTASGVEGS